MRPITLLTLLGVLSITAALASARQGTVRTKDGRDIEGDITENDNEVTIATRVASVTFNRSDIAGITYAATVKEQYEKRLAALPANAGARSHIELARWLFESKEYALARTETDTALKLDANSAEATMLRQAIERTMLLEKTKATTPVIAPKSAPAPGPVVTPPAKRRLLDFDQINAIRQEELKKGEQFRVRFEKNVVQRFIQAKKLTAKDFAKVQDSAKAWQIMEEAPDMKGDVKIASDPVAISDFKHLQPGILAGCASANCHGTKDKGGTFMLYPADNSDAVTYTNFYILTQYNPSVNGAVRKCIDRQQPKSSLLLEYGLPREATQTPHPDVPDFTPMFRGTGDPRYLLMAKWMETLIVTEREYKITFALPGGAPATQPVGAPETQPTVQPVPQPDQTTPAPQPQPDNTRPRPDNRPGNGGGGVDDALKDARGRMRPIRPF